MITSLCPSVSFTVSDLKEPRTSYAALLTERGAQSLPACAEKPGGGGFR